MTTLKKVLTEHKRLCKEAFDMVEKKGADYNRQQQLIGDTLFNLTVAHKLGIVDSTTKSIPNFFQGSSSGFLCILA